MFSRKKSQSIIVYLMFAAIIIVFVISFGPGEQGCSSEPQYVAIVNGEPISIAEYRFEYNQLFNRAQSYNPKFDGTAAKAAGLSMQALESLENMILFANKAEEMGFGASDEEVRDLILNTTYFQTSGKFDKELYKKMVQFQFNMSVAEYEKKARRAILYSKIMNYLSSTVSVSEAEVKELYLKKTASAAIEYYAFNESSMKPEVLEALKTSLTDEDIKAYMTKNEKDLSERYESGKKDLFKDKTLEDAKMEMAKKDLFDAKFGQVSELAAKKALELLKTDGFDTSKLAEELADWNIEAKQIEKLMNIGYIMGIGYDKETVDAIFADKKTGFLQNVLKKGVNSYVLNVKSFSVADLSVEEDKAAFEKVQERVRQSIASTRLSDVVSEFGRKIKEKAYITVNSKALGKITSEE